MTNNQKLLGHSFGHALFVVAYTSGVAWIMFNASRLFAPHDTIFTPIALLLLLVVSAAIVGTLVFGRPIILFLSGQKSEALKMLSYTICWLVLATVIFLALNLK